MLGADGKRKDVSIVRVGQSNRDDCRIQQQNSKSRNDRYDKNTKSNSNQTMQEIVERVTLENVCDRRIKDISRRPVHNNKNNSFPPRGIHGSQLRFADIRKQVRS